MADSSIVSNFYSDTLIDGATLTATGYSIAVVTALVPILYGFSVVWDIVNRALNTIEGERPAYFSKKELVRLGAIVLIAGPGYLAVFYPLATAADAINHATRPASAIDQNINAFIDYSQNQIPQSADTVLGSQPPVLPTPGQGGSSGSGFSFGKAWDALVGGVYSIISEILTSITLVIVGIVRNIIVVMSIVLARIFFALGPLAIAFSILPMFKDKIVNWFGVFLNILFVPLTCNLLDVIIFSNLNVAIRGLTTDSPDMVLIFNVVMIVCYCLAFWLTSFYVGSSAAGRVLSTAVAGATSVVTGLYGAAAGGAGAAASGAAGKAGNIIENTASAAGNTK